MWNCHISVDKLSLLLLPKYYMNSRNFIVCCFWMEKLGTAPAYLSTDNYEGDICHGGQLSKKKLYISIHIMIALVGIAWLL